MIEILKKSTSKSEVLVIRQNLKDIQAHASVLLTLELDMNISNIYIICETPLYYFSLDLPGYYCQPAVITIVKPVPQFDCHSSTLCVYICARSLP